MVRIVFNCTAMCTWARTVSNRVRESLLMGPAWRKAPGLRGWAAVSVLFAVFGVAIRNPSPLCLAMPGSSLGRLTSVR